MNTLLDIVGNSKYDFAGPLVFASLVLFGILMGFWNGYKTATFFFVLNIFCLAGAIAIFSFSKDIAVAIIPGEWKVGRANALDLLRDGLRQTAAKNPSLNISAALINDNNGVAGIKNMVGAVIALGAYFTLNVFLFIPLYFFFRKSLKEGIRENKRLKISNLKQRLGGSLIGFVIAFPIAATTSALLTPLGSEGSGFVNIIDEVAAIVAAKQADNIPQNIFDLAKLAKKLA